MYRILDLDTLEDIYIGDVDLSELLDEIEDTQGAEARLQAKEDWETYKLEQCGYWHKGAA